MENLMAIPDGNGNEAAATIAYRLSEVIASIRLLLRPRWASWLTSGLSKPPALVACLRFRRPRGAGEKYR